MAATELQPGAGLRIPNPAPVDAKYCKPQVGEEPAQPYANVAEACQLVPQPVRYNGLTVNVAGVDYEWRFDLSNNGLQPKATGVGVGPSTGGTYLETFLAYTAPGPIQLPDGTAQVLSIYNSSGLRLVRLQDYTLQLTASPPTATILEGAFVTAGKNLTCIYRLATVEPEQPTTAGVWDVNSDWDVNEDWNV